MSESFPHLARPGENTHVGGTGQEGTGAGGDSRIGKDDGMFRKGRNPADRPTTLDAAATNHDHPSAPGAITGHAGGGLDSGVGTAIDSPPVAADTDGTPAAQQGLTNGGINRVEDQNYTGNPRLNPATDEAGPGPSAQTPELQDPNYTAASERAKD